jgi:hypothetical protein
MQSSQNWKSTLVDTVTLFVGEEVYCRPHAAA